MQPAATAAVAFEYSRMAGGLQSQITARPANTKNDLHLTKETKLMSTNNTNKLANKVVGASTKAPNHSAKKSSGGWTPNPGASPGVRTPASNGSPRNGSFPSSHAPSRSA